MRGGSPEDIVPEKELPERLIKEFAIITEGVLSTFAVQSIAVVRRAAHHIVAVFRKELDGTHTWLIDVRSPIPKMRRNSRPS